MKRVLARHFLVEGWPGQGAVARKLWRLSEALTPHREVGRYNQAMMDLGATCCTRQRPACGRCPLRASCAARESGLQTEYPAPRPKRRLPVREVQMLILRDPAGRILLERRPPAGIWGGLWSLPELMPGQDARPWLQAHFALEAHPALTLAAREHAFTHFRLRIHPRLFLLKEPGRSLMDGDRQVWYNPSDPETRGLAAPVQALLDEIESLEPQP